VKINKLSIYFTCLVLAAMLGSCTSSGSKEINTDNPDKAYEIAKRIYDRGDYTGAIDAFSFLLKISSGTEHADQIKFYLGESYFHEKDYLNAIFEYSDLLKNNVSSPLYSDAMYKLALTYYTDRPKYPLDQEYTEYAIKYFEMFKKIYPYSKYIEDVKLKLNDLIDQLALKNFMVAKQYMILEDYKSAAIYYQSVCEDYLDSKYAEEAFVLQAEALINLKKYSEANNLLNWFFKIYKNSKFKAKATNLKNSIPKQ
jgi:outer membrane protein assembly factor BamD